MPHPRLAHAKALGDRHDRIFQALGGVHRHDAHRAVALLVERARGFLARQEAVKGQRNGARRVTELGLRFGHGVERLEHVGGNGLASGPRCARRTNQPEALTTSRAMLANESRPTRRSA